MARTPKDPNAPDVDPRTKFVEVANKRTSTAMRALAAVAKLPVKGRKDSDVTAIVGALRAAIDTVEKRLASSTPEAPIFTLPE